MVRSSVKTYRYLLGKNHILVINIHQSASATASQGNVLASNAANVQIIKSKKKR